MYGLIANALRLCDSENRHFLAYWLRAIFTGAILLASAFLAGLDGLALRSYSRALSRSLASSCQVPS